MKEWIDVANANCVPYKSNGSVLNETLMQLVTVFPEEIIAHRIFNKFISFNLIRKFITVFTTARQINPVSPPYPICHIHFNTLHTSTPRSFKWSLSFSPLLNPGLCDTQYVLKYYCQTAMLMYTGLATSFPIHKFETQINGIRRTARHGTKKTAGDL